MFLVELLNLTFEREPSHNRDLNVKFVPLAVMDLQQPTGSRH